MTRRSLCVAAALLTGALASGPSWAGEHPIGEPIEKNGLQVLGIYLQAVEMEPAMADQSPSATDIHLEADIHALAQNPNGFRLDSWVPYLNVRYTLTKKGSAWKAEGKLLAMVANDGPHYGANVKLAGAGAYALVLHIAPPAPMELMRHTDKETGVAPWWTPFDYTGSFNYVGTGKKGGY